MTLLCPESRKVVLFAVEHTKSVFDGHIFLIRRGSLDLFERELPLFYRYFLFCTQLNGNFTSILKPWFENIYTKIIIDRIYRLRKSTIYI